MWAGLQRVQAAQRLAQRSPPCETHSPSMPLPRLLRRTRQPLSRFLLVGAAALHALHRPPAQQQPPWERPPRSSPLGCQLVSEGSLSLPQPRALPCRHSGCPGTSRPQGAGRRERRHTPRQPQPRAALARPQPQQQQQPQDADTDADLREERQQERGLHLQSQAPPQPLQLPRPHASCAAGPPPSSGTSAPARRPTGTALRAPGRTTPAPPAGMCGGREGACGRG